MRLHTEAAAWKITVDGIICTGSLLMRLSAEANPSPTQQGGSISDLCASANQLRAASCLHPHFGKRWFSEVDLGQQGVINVRPFVALELNCR